MQASNPNAVRFEVKIITGGVYPATEYDEENVLREERQSVVRSAIWVAQETRGAVDIIDPTDHTRVARVHPDGGVDWADHPAARAIRGH